MLWIYINNTGTIECQVNVGNKIRQGDGFQCFVVPWNMNGENPIGPDISEFSTLSVHYLCPPNLDYRVADEAPTAMAKTFHLKAPSEVNSYFRDNAVYNGFLANIPATATDFAANGGNIMLEFRWVTNGTGGETYTHSQDLSVFVEPTVGAKKTLIGEDNYAYIMNLLKQANFVLSFPMTVDTEHGASAIPDDPSAFPTIMLSKSFGFVKGKLNVAREQLEDGMDGDGFCTIAHFTNQNVELKMPATVFGRDQEGNDIQLRLNHGGDHTINLDLFISDIDETTPNDVIEFFGSCWVDATYLDFSDAETSGLLISGVTASAVEGSPVGVTATIEEDSSDPTAATLDFQFTIPKGEAGQDGQDGADGVGVLNMEQVQTSGVGSGVNIWRMNLTNGESYDFNVRNGADGVNGVNGANGMKSGSAVVVGGSALVNKFNEVGPEKVYAVFYTDTSTPPNTYKEFGAFELKYVGSTLDAVNVYDCDGNYISDANAEYTVCYYTDADPLVIDSALNRYSQNPVKNQTITVALQKACLDLTGTSYVDLDSFLGSCANYFGNDASYTKIIAYIGNDFAEATRMNSVGQTPILIRFTNGMSSGIVSATYSGGWQITFKEETEYLGSFASLNDLINGVDLANAVTYLKKSIGIVGSDVYECEKVASGMVRVSFQGREKMYKYSSVSSSWVEYVQKFEASAGTKLQTYLTDNSVIYSSFVQFLINYMLNGVTIWWYDQTIGGKYTEVRINISGAYPLFQNASVALYASDGQLICSVNSSSYDTFTSSYAQNIYFREKIS